MEAEATEKARVDAEATETARVEAGAAEKAQVEAEATEKAQVDAEATERARVEQMLQGRLMLKQRRHKCSTGLQSAEGTAGARSGGSPPLHSGRERHGETEAAEKTARAEAEAAE